MVLDKTIEIKRIGKDRYKRTIGKLYLNGVYINEYMVVNGEAWAYLYHGNIYRDELEARKQRVGLWRFNNPEPPYLYRKEHKY